MTYTLAQMMDEVQINLSGYTYQQDRSTYLTAAVTTLTSPSTAPLVLSIGSTQDTYNAAVTTYEFENLSIENILAISWQDIGPTKEWIRVKRWDFDPFADVNTWGSNSQTITIGDVIIAGRTVKVMYATSPSVFTSTSQDYTTQTGLPESTKDVVILGAAYRLLQYLDPARAAQYSPQADEIDAKRPFGASNTAVRQLFALYTQRLNEERSKQQNQYPPRVHYSAR